MAAVEKKERKKYTPEQKTAIVAAIQAALAAGTSIKDACEGQGIYYNLYQSWLNAGKPKAKKSKPKKKASVAVPETKSVPATNGVHNRLTGMAVDFPVAHVTAEESRELLEDARRRRAAGGISVDEENAILKGLVANLTIENAILKSKVS